MLTALSYNKLLRFYRESKNLQIVFIALIIFLVYYPTLNNDFVWDDEFYIYSYPFVKDFNFLSQFLSQDFLYGYYRPLPLLTFTVDYQLADGYPWIFHLTNLLIHIFNTVLVIYLARLLLIRNIFTLMAGVFYGLHPVLVEPIAWISGRFDLTVTLFIMLALVADQIKLSSRRIPLVCLCFFLAALCKEMAITFPIVLILWHLTLSKTAPNTLISDFWRYSKTHDNIKLYFATIITGCIYLALRHHVIGYLNQSNINNRFDTPLQHLLLIVKSIGHYLSIIIWPFTQLSPLHEQEFPVELNDYLAWSALFLVVILISIWFLKIKRSPCIFWLGIAFLVSLTPVIHLLPLSIGNNIIHERFLTFPLVVFVLLLFKFLNSLKYSKKDINLIYETDRKNNIKNSFIPAAVIIGIFWISFSILNIRITLPLWETSFRLWSWALQKDPKSDYAKINLMTIYAYHDLEKAKSIFDTIEKKGVMAWKTMGLIKLKEHKYEESIIIYEQVIDQANKDNTMTSKMIQSGIYNNIGICLINLKKYEEARKFLFNAIEAYSLGPEPYANIAESYIYENRLNEAQEFIAKAKQFSTARLEPVIKKLDQLLIEKNQLNQERKNTITPIN